jgi:hypothetical protein
LIQCGSGLRDKTDHAAGGLHALQLHARRNVALMTPRSARKLSQLGSERSGAASCLPR